jgi:hypothetical protein
MWYLNLEKTFISWHILHQHWYTFPIALPVHWKLQHRSLLTVVSATSPYLFQPLCHERNVCYQGNCFTWQTPGNISLWISFTLSPFAHRKCRTEHRSSVIHSSSTVAIVTTETSSEHTLVHLLPRLSWSWTVLLPSDTHRKPINIHYGCCASICDLFTESPS